VGKEGFVVKIMFGAKGNWGNPQRGKGKGGCTPQCWAGLSIIQKRKNGPQGKKVMGLENERVDTPSSKPASGGCRLHNKRGGGSDSQCEKLGRIRETWARGTRAPPLLKERKGRQSRPRGKGREESTSMTKDVPYS